MKAVIIREHGGIDKLLYEDVEKPAAGPGEVQSRHTRAGSLRRRSSMTASSPW